MKEGFKKLKVLVNRIKRMPRNVGSARTHRLKTKVATCQKEVTIDSLNKQIEDLTDKHKKKDKMLVIYENNIENWFQNGQISKK